MSGDPSLKDPVIFYSEELTKTKIVLLSLKGIQLNFIEEDKKILEKVEKKFNLSPYQSKCANAAIGFILGALIL